MRERENSNSNWMKLKINVVSYLIFNRMVSTYNEGEE